MTKANIVWRLMGYKLNKRNTHKHGRLVKRVNVGRKQEEESMSRECKAVRRTTRTIKIFFIIPASLHHVTTHPMPSVEAVLPKDGDSWNGGDWEAAPFCFGPTQFFFFRWHQEHSSGNVPSSFPFSVLLFLSPLSQSSELWDYDPEMGLVSIFQFLHFLLPLWEGREHCIIWTMVIMLFSPIH